MPALLPDHILICFAPPPHHHHHHQVRVGDLLSHVLRHYRHSQYLGLVLPWRPLYDMLMGIYDNPTPSIRGETRTEGGGGENSPS